MRSKATGPLTGVGMIGTGKNKQFSYPYPYPRFTRTRIRTGYPNPCSCLAPTVVLTSSRSIPVEQDGEPIEPTSTGLHPPHAGVAGKAENSQWHGPGAKVYRNYHSKLTGEFSDLNVCLSHPLSLTCRAPL